MGWDIYISKFIWMSTSFIIWMVGFICFCLGSPVFILKIQKRLYGLGVQVVLC